MALRGGCMGIVDQAITLRYLRSELNRSGLRKGWRGAAVGGVAVPMVRIPLPAGEEARAGTVACHVAEGAIRNGSSRPAGPGVALTQTKLTSSAEL